MLMATCMTDKDRSHAYGKNTTGIRTQTGARPPTLGLRGRARITASASQLLETLTIASQAWRHLCCLARNSFLKSWSASPEERPHLDVAHAASGFAGLGPPERLGQRAVEVDDEVSIRAFRCSFDVKLARRSSLRARIENQISIWLSQEACLGVK